MDTVDTVYTVDTVETIYEYSSCSILVVVVIYCLKVLNKYMTVTSSKTALLLSQL